jgi:dihydrodipicolinate synthase/N-acetylneuraminate lyase
MESHTLTDEEIEQFVKRLMDDNKIEEFIYAIEILSNEEIPDDTVININKNVNDEPLYENLETKKND